MKAYLIGLMGLAALACGSAFGQALPMALPTGPGAPAPAALPMAVPPQGACCTTQGCCTPTKKICVPEQYMKKTTKAVYSCGCQPACIDYRWGLFKKCSCCGDNNPTPMMKKYLIKKVKTTECPAVKCVPVEVPCEQTCCPSSGCCNK